MAVKQFLMTYDDVEHKEIHDFLNSIPSRQKSKYLRIAILEYLRKNNFSDEKQDESNTKTRQFVNEQDITDKQADFVEVDSLIFDLGT